MHVLQRLHRFAGVVGVKEQWISWKAVAEDGFLLAEGAAVLDVVYGLIVEETSVLKRQVGGPLLGPTINENSICGGVCKLRTAME